MLLLMIICGMVIFLSIVFMWIRLIWVLCDWSNYIKRTKDESNKYGWANYDKFIYYWEKEQLKPSRIFPNEVFKGYDKDSVYSKRIIKFNGNGMLLNPIDWIRVKRYIEKENRCYKW